MLFRYITNKDVVHFEIPKYPELAVKNVWQLIKTNEVLFAYFPDLKESQFPEKEYMYGVISTIKPDAVRELVAEGMKSRWPVAQDDHSDLVEVSGDLKHAITNLFSIKSKSNRSFTISIK